MSTCSSTRTSSSQRLCLRSLGLSSGGTSLDHSEQHSTYLIGNTLEVSSQEQGPVGVMLDKNNMGPESSVSFSPNVGRVPFLLFRLGGATSWFFFSQTFTCLPRPPDPEALCRQGGFVLRPKVLGSDLKKLISRSCPYTQTPHPVWLFLPQVSPYPVFLEPVWAGSDQPVSQCSRKGPILRKSVGGKFQLHPE